MRRLYLIIIILFPLIGFGQKQETLSDILWSRVNSCYSMLEDFNEDKIPEFEKIDDTKNGYLKVSGSWPTCGCSCSSTVGAYKNNDGDYIILQSDKIPCSWEKKISSNLDIKKILPIDFGIKSFTSNQIDKTLNYSIFFVDFEIPRTGTDTKITIELVPFGLKPDKKDLICYNYKQLEMYSNCKSLYKINRIAAIIESDETLDFILSGDFDKIRNGDRKIISDAIGKGMSQFNSNSELQKYLIELKEIFNIYQSLNFLEMTLGWDKRESRFYIKDFST